MQVESIENAARRAVADPSVVEKFTSLWPLFEDVLESFARATGLPLFVFMNGEKLFQSSDLTMPPFCLAMLTDERTLQLCVTDGQRRASSEPPPGSDGLQLCHAGMLNGRRKLDLGILGELVILFGSRKAPHEEAARRRSAIIAKAEAIDEALAESLRAADRAGLEVATIADDERALMDAIARAVEQLFKVTIGHHWISINLAHELSNLLLGTGLMAKDLDESLLDSVRSSGSVDLREMQEVYSRLLSESQLGIYEVRNFLSYVSETRYRAAVEMKRARIDTEGLVRNMVALHEPIAAGKGVKIEIDEKSEFPAFFGFDQELRRAVHNVLSNAIKYSYRALPNRPRVVRIWTKIPYDPGFREHRFAVVFENYGLGVSSEELLQVTKPGFRGGQAIAEVPIGSGIGLAEVRKIMYLHGGDLKFRSREVHRDEEGKPTYVTCIELILPLRAAS
jgi:signal transduction histidine kinase